MAKHRLNQCSWMSSLIVLAVTLNLCSLANGKKIFCYYSSFAYTREGRGNFVPEDINPHLCTHIIYAFVDVSPDGTGIVPFNKDDQGENGLYARTLALKKKNPDLKVLLAVGGWLIGSQPFLPVVISEESRDIWIRNVVKYLRKHGFDGFDMDWEFPATRGSPPQDKFRFTQLMKGLYEAFARESEDTGNDKLILTMATASGTYYISQSYEPSKIINYLDYMLLMTYNYHGQWEKLTGHHSGLYPHRLDPKVGEKSQLYQEWSIDFWLNAGIPKEKLIVGIPTYAMTFTLSDQSQHGVRAPAISGGRKGEFTKETGILSYYEICDRLQNGGWHSEWIEEQGVPFAYGGDQWAGYENKRSITLKAKNIQKRDLGGAFVWSVEMGDFDGYCGQGPYPLLQAINDVIKTGAPAQPASKLNQISVKTLPRIKNAAKKDQRRAKKILNEDMTTHRTTVEGRPRFIHKPEFKIKKNVANSKQQPKDGNDAPKKIKWRPGNSQRRRRVQVSPGAKRSQSHKFEDKRFHDVTPVIRKTTPQNTTQTNEDAVHEDEQLTWWFRPSPRPPTTGWTTAFWGRRRPWTANKKKWTKSSAQNVTSKPHRSKPSKEQASASAAISRQHQICPVKGIGLYQHPHSCDHYVICLAGSWFGQPHYVMSCPAGTKFDSDLRICNFANHVQC